MKIKLNWYVITGGPSSGKTTIINELSKLGYLIVPNMARVYIDQEIVKGKSLKELRSDEAKFQRKILKIKIEAEEKMPKDKIVFLDNAVPCSIAYYQICGLDPKEVIQLCQKEQYRKVFFLEQLPFEQDRARTENLKTIGKLNRLLREAYENLGYEVVFVPRFTPIRDISIAKRLELILTHVHY